jgi:hypothetical protein
MKTLTAPLGSAIAALLLGLAGTASAATVSYTLDHTDSANVPNGASYLTVTLSDAAFGADANAIRFDVALADGLSGLGTDAMGINSFAFNTTGNATTVANAVAGQPAGWFTSTNRNMGAFGDFDVKLGGGPTQQALTFYVTGIDGDALTDYTALSVNGTGVFFVAHVGGLKDVDPGDGVDTSVQFGGGGLEGGGGGNEVPLPATVWLFGSGMGLVALFRRKRAMT